MAHAGITAVSVEFPAQVRGNDFWQTRYPEMFSQETEGAFTRLLASNEHPLQLNDAFDAERQPYMGDAFRGARERRILDDDHGTIDLELGALQRLCNAREIDPQDLDAIMVYSMLPESLGSQNAAHLTACMGLTIPAWNIESTCNSLIVGLQSAAALVRADEYRRIAVVASIASSKLISPDDTLSWFMGDGAGALLIEPCAPGSGVLATKLIGTQDSCGAWKITLETDSPTATPRFRWRAGKESAGRLMRDHAARQLTTCVHGALDKAGHTLEDVDFFIFNTPVAWFAQFCAKTLGVPADKTISTYESYANVGAVLTAANLFHAAHEGKIKPGDLVVLFGVGSGSTAGSAVMRWGEVSLTSAPIIS